MNPTTRVGRLAALVLVAVPLALAAAQAGEAAPAGAPVENMHVQIATVFDQPIYLDSLTPHESVVEGNRTRIGDEAKFQEWLEVQRSRVLCQLIFKLLSNSYMQENGITCSEQEIDDFLKKEKVVYQEVLNKYRDHLRDLDFRRQQLEAAGKPVPAELEDDVKVTKNKIDAMERENIDSMVISAKQRRMHDEVQRERVSNALRAWKFNKLLHDQFGGKVIPANLTYEPYEAYAAWLQTQQQLGHFEISDEKLNADFWAYYNRQPQNALEPFPGMWDHLRWADSKLP